MNLASRARSDVFSDKSIRVTNRDSHISKATLIGSFGGVANDDRQGVDRKMIHFRMRHRMRESESAITTTEVEHQGRIAAKEKAGAAAPLRQRNGFFSIEQGRGC